MIPLVATLNEMVNQAEIVNRVAKEVFNRKGMHGRVPRRHNDRVAARRPGRR